MFTTRSLFSLLITLVAVALAQGWTSEGGLILRGDIVTMDENLRVIPNGRLVVRGDRIVAVLEANQPLPDSASLAGALILETDGWVFPGLIDAHNHVAYDFLPLYSVPKKYDNRYQWTGPKSYRQYVKQPYDLIQSSKNYDLLVEGVKYAEVKALTGGVTSIQGTPDRKATRYLVRNVENGPFGEDRIGQYGLALTAGNWDPDAVRQQMEQNLIDAWIIHLAEGTDDKSRQEFEYLKQLRLLTDKTVGIHCAGLTPDQFRQMAEAGTKAVWSPTSNLLLYGQTADIPAALRAGVHISLGADWSPSGCKNLLGEMKIADKLDELRFGNVISDTLLVKMVTVNPAFALGFDAKVGQLKTGYYADVAVFDKVRADPYRSLIDANERNVRLVMVGGDPLYGDTAVMRRLKPGDYEVLDAGGKPKGLDITNQAVEMGDQTFAEITVALQQALRADFDHMHEAFGGDLTPEQFASALAGQFQYGLVPIRLDPVFAFGDTYFFRMMNTSANAGFGFDVSQFWQVQASEDPGQRALALVNSPSTTLELLDVVVGLERRAAENIIAHRDGPDAQPGTADDDRFDDLAELDAVPYVGSSTIQKLKTYATTH